MAPEATRSRGSVQRDPPLDPSPDEARDALRRELLRPEYADDNLLQRALEWIDRQLEGTVDTASQTPSLVWFAATAVVLGLVVGVALLVSRARRSTRTRAPEAAVLTGESVTAAQLRARAEQAFAERRWSEAVVDGFRAVAVGQVERGRLDDTPGATAHEVSLALVAQHPEQAPALTAGADLFDAVMYGERPATRDQAAQVLGLDEALRSRR